ncbi:hypothetical protein [Labrenzia sp. 011]|uniref:hypothetical protein n=1 Tax=Labrenzia sp. 011 TaxID=2171494 RepID=UPI000D5227A1|nr:hypothetical protein [Labrenzia sp. 011]PVB63692.1 hypothetical protein DCO57_02625 [Labrenzia sp. 011]
MPFQFNVGDHSSSILNYTRFDSAQYGKLKWARNRLFRMVKNIPGCNAYFRTLPGGRSLSDMIGDSGIWVNYGSGLSPLYGEIHVPTGEIAVGDRAFNMGRWMVLATLVHELAHHNGAPITGGDTRAEEAVYHCGLGNSREYYDGVDDPNTPYDPSVGG